jgi:LDH2 family malate/lactate/ureidoglycolate dehydrogenase
LGTNPISIAVPAGDEPPFLLDIATTVASHGSIKVVAQAGEQMPVGWVIDANGDPITDPERAHEGFLMPIGGYKGSGLNIAIGLLAGVMNGAAFGKSVIDHRVQLSTPTNTGQAIFVLRCDLFMPAEEMHRSVAEHLDELRQAGPSKDAVVRLPGDRAAEVEATNSVEGVPVSALLLTQLDELAARLEIDPLSP